MEVDGLFAVACYVCWLLVVGVFVAEGVERRLVHVLFELGLAFEAECLGWLLGVLALVVGFAVRVASGVVEEGLSELAVLAVAVKSSGSDLALPVVRPHPR